MSFFQRVSRNALPVICAAGMLACSDSSPAPTTSAPSDFRGVVTNLQAPGLVLMLDGQVTLEVEPGATSFTFVGASPLEPHEVVIAALPTGQACRIVESAAVEVDCGDRPSCKVIHAEMPDIVTGAYRIDVDGYSGFEPFTTLCDMTWDGGGWTAILSSAERAGPKSLVAGSVTRGSKSFLPYALMQRLAESASQVHVRSTDHPDGASITSLADNEIIANLRRGRVVDDGLHHLSPTEQAARWTGPYATPERLYHECITVNAAWPDVFWACGNELGFHLVDEHATWSWQRTGAKSLNTSFEVYVR